MLSAILILLSLPHSQFTSAEALSYINNAQQQLGVEIKRTTNSLTISDPINQTYDVVNLSDSYQVISWRHEDSTQAFLLNYSENGGKPVSSQIFQNPQVKR